MTKKGLSKVVGVALAGTILAALIAQRFLNQNRRESLRLAVPAERHTGPAATNPKTPSVKLDVPVSFVENRGQLNAEAKFVVRFKGACVFFTANGFVVSRMQRVNANDSAISRAVNQPLDAPNSTSVYRSDLYFTFEGASADARASGENRISGIENYYIGNDHSRWVENVATFERLRYQELYRGIDAEIHARSGQLEYDLVVEPGSDPSCIV